MHIEKLNYETQQDELKTFFEDQNLSIKRIKLLHNSKGQQNGECYIEFGSTTDADYAMNVLNGMPYCSRPLNNVLIMEYSKYHYE